jgi:hypothetical protein
MKLDFLLKKLDFLQNLKTMFFSSKKFWKNQDVIRDVFYKYVKFQFKRPYTLAYTKMTSSIFF